MKDAQNAINFTANFVTNITNRFSNSFLTCFSVNDKNWCGTSARKRI